MEAKDYDGRKPLSWAVDKGHEAIVQVVRETSVGATQSEQQIAARRNYQAAITPLAKIPKDFAKWIPAWEMATNSALVMKTGGVDDPNTWFDDLAKAIQPVLGNWVTIYRGIYEDKLEGKTLTIGEVAKDL
ncbi:Uncharacterized protein LW94_10590 [Fusarium fujikuroi]|nr:Uncharacterized protein LW94_10590 [Fusarium fujikuroi]SCO47768.1 uncharacterized protein FFMR_08834 [Fusarium fujikuroi]